MNKVEASTVMGKVTSVYGVKGWVKVVSYAQPRENICKYKTWTLEDKSGQVIKTVKVTKCKAHGNGLVAHFEGCDDRDIAKRFCDTLISVPSEELPELPEGEYYWHQLQGLKVYCVSVDSDTNALLGEVSHLIETGSNDVLVVKKCSGSLDGRERLIPYLPDQVVKTIDLEEGVISVEWDPDF